MHVIGAADFVLSKPVSSQSYWWYSSATRVRVLESLNSAGIVSALSMLHGILMQTLPSRDRMKYFHQTITYSGRSVFWSVRSSKRRCGAHRRVILNIYRDHPGKRNHFSYAMSLTHPPESTSPSSGTFKINRWKLAGIVAATKHGVRIRLREL